MARLIFTIATLLALTGCVPSPLYVARPHKHGSSGDVPRDERGEPIWSEIRQPSAVPLPPPPFVAPQGVPITPPPPMPPIMAEGTPAALTPAGTPVVRTVTVERQVTVVHHYARRHHRHHRHRHRHHRTIIHTRTVTTIR